MYYFHARESWVNQITIITVSYLKFVGAPYINHNSLSGIVPPLFLISYLSRFFPLFSKYIYALCNDLPSLIYTTHSVLQDFQQDGVVYLELRTTPRAMPSAKITKDIYIQTILDCITKHNKSDPSMKTNLILSIDRRNDLQTALEVVTLAHKYHSHGVVGIDLCGDPSIGDISIFSPAFQLAHTHNLKITIHFAEIPHPPTRTELRTLLSYHPHRLGHVIHVPDDLKPEIQKMGLGLELCLSCNVHAKMITGTYGDHHFGEWWGRGAPVVLCVCNVTLSSPTLSPTSSHSFPPPFITCRCTHIIHKSILNP